MSAGLLLAHGGGAPEAASVGLPLLVVAGLVLVERRARRKAREDDAEEREE